MVCVQGHWIYEHGLVTESWKPPINCLKLIPNYMKTVLITQLKNSLLWNWNDHY
jgi:hypothetical protein